MINQKIKWSEEEIELLKKEYPINHIENLVQLFPNRLENAIIKKAKRLGLKKTILKKNRSSMKKWSEEEIEILKEYYPITKNSEICKYLPNRTSESIISKANDMKISKEYTYLWSEEEINFLKNNYKNITIKKIGDKIGKSKDSILNMMSKLYLKVRIPIDLSYENCIATGKLFKDKTSLRKKHPHMYQVASKNGWIEEMTSHMIPIQFSTPQLICQYLFDKILNEKSSYNNRKIIAPYELDIYYEKLKLAIEYNGIKWHNSEDVVERDRMKKKLCEENGICLIIIEQKKNNKKAYLNDIKKDVIEYLDFINIKFNKNIKKEDIENIEVDITDRIMDYNDVMEYCLKYDNYTTWRLENEPMYNMLRRYDKLEQFTKHMKKWYEK